MVSCGEKSSKAEVDTDVFVDDKMTDVPAAEFQMGCNNAIDTVCRDDENPYHKVMINAFRIDKYEVSAGDYKKCVDAGACNNNNSAELHYLSFTEDMACNFGPEGKYTNPMNCVSWYGAKAYCEWAGKRLATEAEWEKAARGLDGQKFPWGNDPLDKERAIYTSTGTSRAGTAAIGSKETGKSPYGAYDMIGNVREWVNDWYSDTYYGKSSLNNPQGPGSSDKKSLRGGSWASDDEADLRASSRYGKAPSARDTDIGLRCVK